MSNMKHLIKFKNIPFTHLRADCINGGALTTSYESGQKLVDP